MTACEIASKVRSQELSASSVTEAAIARMELFEDSIHAYCTPGKELARAMAKEIDRKISKGEDPGVMAGVPVGIKDLVATKDLKTVMGCKVYENFTPEEDDVVVERLKGAGAIIFGKTNVPELGYSGVGHNPVFETTRNPWNLAMTPGGSSAGSGASVACGVTPLAIGSDGGGSIRIPAAHCGLYGMKASMGRVPLYPGCRDPSLPGVSSWASLECIGPMARNVEDAALMFSVISGPDPRDRLSIPLEFDWLQELKESFDLKGKKIGFSKDWGYAAVDQEVAAIVKACVYDIFQDKLGCVIEEADPGFSDPYGAFWGLVAGDSDLKGMRKWLPDHAHHMSPHLVDFLQKPWTAEELTTAGMHRHEVTNKMSQFMSNYDLLITPTLAVPPFPVHTQGPEKINGHIVHPVKWLCFTFIANMTGQPAATLPAGFTKDGLPVGLQIMGKHLDDKTVLKASKLFQEAKPWKDHWPNLVNDLVV